MEKSVKKSNHKKILMILQSEYPPDIRVSKEMKTLLSVGHAIYLLCHNKSGRNQHEMIDGAMVIRLNPFIFLNSKLRAIVAVPLFFNPVWFVKIAVMVMKYRIQIIHVHDLPLLLAGIIIGKFWRIPIVFDAHENYPAALALWWRRDIFHFLFRNPQFAEMLEKLCLKLVDHIIVVATEHKNLFISRSVPGDKISVVENTVEHDLYTNLKIDKNIVASYQNFFTLGYVGKFGPERDIETSIRALKFLNNKIPNLKLLLVGDGPNMEQLKSIAHEEKVTDKVEFIGWVDFNLTASYIEASRICVIPQPSNPLIDNGVPHKLFQYMVLGKPVIVSNAQAMARIVQECQCGEVFKSHSSKDFANAVLRIYHSSINYGENGRRAVFTKYNWENSSKELVKLYHK